MNYMHAINKHAQVKPLLYAVCGAVLGILFSMAKLFALSSPFSVSIVCIAYFAIREKRNDISSTLFYLFCIFGSLFGIGFFNPDRIKYFLCIVLSVTILSAAIKRGFSKYKNILLCVCCFLSVLSVGIAVSAAYNFMQADVFYAISDAIICLCFTYFCQKALLLKDTKEPAQSSILSAYIILCVLFCALINISIFSINIAHIAAMSAIMLLGAYSNMQTACLFGVLSGICLTFSTPEMFFYIIAFSVGGIMCGLFNKLSKFFIPVCFVLTACVVSLYFGGAETAALTLYETLVSSLIFLLIPKKIFKRLNLKTNVFKKELELKVSSTPDISKAFKSAADILDASTYKHKCYERDNAYDDVCSLICKNCFKFCLTRDYSTVLDVFNNLYDKYILKGCICPSDAPDYFHDMCPMSQEVVYSLNKNFLNVSLSRQRQKKSAENAEILINQFRSLGNICSSEQSEAVKPLMYETEFYYKSLSKQTNTPCGDNMSVFKCGSKQIFALSDGMGSGENAFNDSKLSLALLKCFLENGFDKNESLKLVASTLALKSLDERFVAMDIVMFDQTDSSCEFIKAGAAQSLIMRENKIYELDCANLPMGIVNGSGYEKTKIPLKCDDLILMMSDGFLQNGVDWIISFLKNQKNLLPKELCNALMNEAKNQKIIGEDDVTICIIKIKPYQTALFFIIFFKISDNLKILFYN